MIKNVVIAVLSIITILSLMLAYVQKAEADKQTKAALEQALIDEKLNVEIMLSRKELENALAATHAETLKLQQVDRGTK